MSDKKRVSNNPVGRPRSEELTQRVHSAIWRLLQVSECKDLTMERIAEEAGVTRPALYRRCGGRGQALLTALLAYGRDDLEMPHSRSLESDLKAYFGAVVQSLQRKDPVGKALRGVLSQALVDESFANEFEDFIASRREPVRKRLASENTCWTNQSIEKVLDALFGPILYRLLIRGKAVGTELISELVEDTLSRL